ncbi:phosphoserine phosphatase SerB [Alteromonadales bacterium alter-6D02]|nr:phosphoserine phosphatase SerB [Alteromonadales bacterium alter-6D02]
MDSTSIEIECIDEIAKLAGVGEQVAEITELAMQGQLDFAESLRARVGKLKGIKLELLDVIAKDLPLMPGMTELVKQFKAHQWKVAIASGGFTYFADNLKDLLALDDAVSNVLEHEAGELTGQVVGRIVDAKVKAETVVALAEKYDIPLSQTIAIGDGANDLVMMEQAALGVAYHAKPLVQEQASVAINQGNLAAIIALLKR